MLDLGLVHGTEICTHQATSSELTNYLLALDKKILIKNKTDQL